MVDWIIEEFFCQSNPCIWYCSWKTFDVFISLYVLVEYFFCGVPNSIIKEIEVTGIWRSDSLSDIIRGIFIEIIVNRICCVATSRILLNSEFFLHKINSFLHQDVSSAFQVINAINTRTIFYKEQQAFSNLYIFDFENVIV